MLRRNPSSPPGQQKHRCPGVFFSPMSRRISFLLLTLCALVFAAAVWGSVDCGARLAAGGDSLPPEQEAHLRRLIYFHFALAQLAVVAGVLLFYLRHRRWRRYYLLVSYNEKGMPLDPPGIRMPSRRVWRACLGRLAESPLPPADAPVLVYPMFMLSGYSSGEKLERELAAAYAARGMELPSLYYQPVLGASPWLARAVARHLAPQLQGRNHCGVLVVAHGSRLPEPPPEPALFCRRLRQLLPGVEIALGYFSQQSPAAEEVLRSMQAKHVLLLPFLLTEGIHTSRDLPTAANAAACGKTLHRLPVVPDLMHSPTP